MPALLAPVARGCWRRARRRRATASPGRGTARSGRWPHGHHDAAGRGHEEQGVHLGAVVRPRATGSRRWSAPPRRQPAQMAIVTNWANVSRASARPTSVDRRSRSVTSSQLNIASTRGGHAAAAITNAYGAAGHGGVRAPTSEQEQRRADEHEERRQGEPVDVGTLEAGLGQQAHHSSPSAPGFATSTTFGPGMSTPPRSSMWTISESTLGCTRSMQRLRVHAGEHDDRDQHRQHGALAPRELGERLVGFVGLAVEHPLIGPQQVERGEDHAGGRRHRPPPRREERADQGRGTRRRTRSARARRSTRASRW